MAVVAEPPMSSAAGRARTLLTWGSSAVELRRRIDVLALDDAGVVIDLTDGAEGVRVHVDGGDDDRSAWAVHLVKAGLGDVVVGEEGASLEGAVVALLAREGLDLVVDDLVTGGAVVRRLRAVPGGEVVLVAEAILAADLPGTAGSTVGAAAAEALARGRSSRAALVVAPRSGRGGPTGGVEISSWLRGEARSEHVGRSPRDAAAHALDHLRLRLLAAGRRPHPGR